MPVCVFISPEMEAAPVAAWGRRFAAARGLELDIVVISRRDRGSTDLDLGVGDDVTVRELVAGDLFHAVLDDVAKRKPELVLLARQAPGSAAEEGVRLVRRLFTALHCDTIMLRVGSRDGGECKRVLVPSSGGPHSLTALAWARDLVMADGTGKVVPLFVEPDTGEVAEDVGARRLAKIVRRAGLNPEAPGIEPRVVLADDVRVGIGRVAAEAQHDLLLVGASGIGALRSLLFGTIPERLFKGDAPMAVAVVRRAASLGERVRRAIERWLHLRIPQLRRAERVALFENIESNARWSFDFMMLICLSTAIAGIGLMMNSTAVVIGAMLVAPLMTPLIGSGLALVQGNLPLMRSAARAIIYGFVAALLIGILIGFCSIQGRLTPEIEARGGPGLPDMVIALLSGIAASYCIARPNLSSALAGVAIAAALVPPIATVGIAISLGELGVARGAAILFATNVVAIVLGAAMTFYATGVRGRDASDRSKPVWVQRTILLLGLCALALVVPLGSVLISKVAERVVEDPQKRVFYRVSDKVFAAMKAGVESAEGGRILENISAYRVGATRVLELSIISDQVPDESFVKALAEKATAVSGQQTRVRVSTRLVVEAGPS
jgi:uncharacterized hydrophobic protein (TIGR00271 family)